MSTPGNAGSSGGGSGGLGGSRPIDQVWVAEGQNVTVDFGLPDDGNIGSDPDSVTVYAQDTDPSEEISENGVRPRRGKPPVHNKAPKFKPDKKGRIQSDYKPVSGEYVTIAIIYKDGDSEVLVRETT